MQRNIEISIILGTYNRISYLNKLITNIRNQNISVKYEIIIIDGGSNDGTIDWLKGQKDVITIIQHNRGKKPDGSVIKRQSWGYFMNLGFKIAQGKYLLLLSDDCLLVPDAINNGYSQFERLLNQGKNIGGLAFYWRDWPEKKNYYVIKLFDRKLLMVNHGLFLRNAVEEVGWIEENDYDFYCADSDLACKLWDAGFIILPSENSFVEHFSHANMKVRKSNLISKTKDFSTLYRKWEGKFYTKGGSEGELSYIKHEDTFNTYKKFPKYYYHKNMAIIKKRIFGFISNLKKLIRNI
jgi:GT2 family glycosyltransferase